MPKWMHLEEIEGGCIEEEEKEGVEENKSTLTHFRILSSDKQYYCIITLINHTNFGGKGGIEEGQMC